MRRSAAITLTLLAGAGLGLATCHRGETDAEGVLESQAACVDRLGADAAAECEDVFQSARTTHAGTAPRFGSEEDCRAATGADCTPLVSEPHPAGAPWASAGPTVFIPAMAGVMIGRALSDGSRGAVPVYAGGVPPACLPGAAGGAAGGLPGAAGCPPASSGTGGSGSGGGGSGGGRRYWYSGGSYAGSSEGAARGGFRAATASGQGGTLLSRGASASRAGGFGSSAAAHGGGGS